MLASSSLPPRLLLMLFLLGAMTLGRGQTTPDQPLRPGLEVGSRIPAFEVPDHTGQKRTFESLRGPKGLLLLFHRSADW